MTTVLILIIGFIIEINIFCLNISFAYLLIQVPHFFTLNFFVKEEFSFYAILISKIKDQSLHEVSTLLYSYHLHIYDKHMPLIHFKTDAFFELLRGNYFPEMIDIKFSSVGGTTFLGFGTNLLILRLLTLTVLNYKS